MESHGGGQRPPEAACQGVHAQGTPRSNAGSTGTLHPAGKLNTRVMQSYRSQSTLKTTKQSQGGLQGGEHKRDEGRTPRKRAKRAGREGGTPNASGLGWRHRLAKGLARWQVQVQKDHS